MKVISAPVWWEFTCKACAAVCQAEPADVTTRPNIDCDGDVVGHIPVVECGRCGSQHDVPRAKRTPNKRKRKKFKAKLQRLV